VVVVAAVVVVMSCFRPGVSVEVGSGVWEGMFPTYLRRSRYSDICYGVTVKPYEMYFPRCSNRQLKYTLNKNK
jgi:hypothetical protein